MSDESAGCPVPEGMSYHAPHDLAAVRAFVRARALALGLSPARADLLQLAVSELASNTVLYTDGGGRVRVWSESESVVCDVADSGPGRDFDRAMPSADVVGGRGLPIVRAICDEVRSTAGAGGTVVQLRFFR